jgi:hypothetical protein
MAWLEGGQALGGALGAPSGGMPALRLHTGGWAGWLARWPRRENGAGWADNVLLGAWR